MNLRDFTPLKHKRFWNEAQTILNGRRDASLEKMLRLVRKSFRHELWKRMFKKDYNVDPFRQDSYKLYFFLANLKFFLEKNKKIKISETEFKVLWPLLNLSYIKAPEDAGEMIGYNGRVVPKTEFLWSLVEKNIKNRSLRDEFKALRLTANQIIDDAQGRVLDGVVEYGLCKSLLGTYASMIKIFLSSLESVLSEVEKAKVEEVGFSDLTSAFKKIYGKSNLFLAMFSFYNWLANTISEDGNEEEGDINMNLDAIIPLYTLIRIIIRLFFEVAPINSQEKGKTKIDWSAAPPQKLLILDY